MRTIKRKYRLMVEELVNANFLMSGVGHFDVHMEEIAYILKVLLENRAGKKRYNMLLKFYEELCEIRMG